MEKITRQRANRKWQIVLGGLAALVALPAWAQSSRVVSVEEHWELHIGQPDIERSAPQTTMVMSPSGDLGDVYFIYTLNHSTVPNYHSGGMQVQLWNGTDLVEARDADQGRTLSHGDEIVRWVQKLSLEDDTLSYQIQNGTSETWGSFGGEDLTLSTPTSLTGLNSYRPGVSLSESEVGYADNRVVSLVLTKLVWTTDDGVVHEQNAPIPIDTSFDP